METPAGKRLMGMRRAARLSVGEADGHDKR